MSDDFDPFEDDDPGTTAPEQSADRGDGDVKAAKENGLADTLLGQAAKPIVVLDEEHHLSEEQMAAFANLPPHPGIHVGTTAEEAPDDVEPPEPDDVPLGPGVEDLAGTISFFRGELPSDIASVWAKNANTELTARTLIESWGLETFRESNVHKQAVAEYARAANLGPSRADFKAKTDKKKK